MAIVGVIAACAGTSSRSNRPCPLAPGDTLYLGRGPVYRACAVDRQARSIDHSARPDFQPSTPPPGGQACYRAELEFVVDSTGVPEAETARVVRTNNPTYAQSVMRVLPRWRYEPARLKGVPVRQIVEETAGLGAVLVAVRAGDTPRPPLRPPNC